MERTAGLRERYVHLVLTCFAGPHLAVGGSKDARTAFRVVTCAGCGHRWDVDDV